LTDRAVRSRPVATRSALVNVMAGAASRAARGLNRDFGEVQNLQTSERGPDRFVDAAIARAEEVLAGELRRARREFAYLSGAHAQAGGGAGAWLVEALDGAENYRHGLPWFATAICAREGGAHTAAVIYDPLRDEMFWAERGRGAYVNSQRLRVSARGSLGGALIAVHLGADAAAQAAGLRAAGRIAGLRESGAAALDLAGVAAGRLDGFWGERLAPAIAAAGALLVREAGGLVEDGAGQPMVATNQRLAGALGALIRDPAAAVTR
jgi:myo-inositol-1(or 4)-monophosphatase